MRRFVCIALVAGGCISFEITQKADPTKATVCAASESACDGKDDDCDGLVDEDLVRDCSNCQGGGFEFCAGGGYTGCSAPPLAAETCNNLDDDCSGGVDDGLERACTSCTGTGTEVCVMGDYVDCTAPPGPQEVCNNVDDDCDGTVDDHVTRACFTCKGTGVETCAAGAFGACSAPPPMAEICNGADDDCDTVVDNGFQIGQACDGADQDFCTRGVFQCDGSGGRVCTDTTDPIYDFCAACRAGVPVPATRIGAVQGGALPPVAAWGNNQWGVAWGTSNPGEIWFSRLDANAVPIAGSEVQLSSTPIDSKAPSIAWNGTHFAVAWNEEADPPAPKPTQIHMRRISASGVLVDGTVFNVTNEGGATNRSRWFPRLFWDAAAAEWNVFFNCHPSDYTAPTAVCRRRMNGDLTVATPPLFQPADTIPITVSVGNKAGIVVANAGTHVGLAWEDAATSKIHACSMTLASGVLGACTGRVVSNNTGSGNIALSPSIVVAGGGYRIFWHDDHTGTVSCYSDSLLLDNTAGSLDSPCGSSRRFISAVNAGSDFLIAYELFAGANDEVGVSRVNGTGGVTATIQVTNTTPHSWRPQMSTDGAGVGIVGWLEVGAPAEGDLAVLRCQGP
ncbi:MAG: hypothetical protein IT381_29920 [Deltaproteobacteria bacterium]|nr:hypothetical protein [Deltaproteobacteria bacterium]